MFKVKVNGKNDYLIEQGNTTAGKINGEAFEWNVISLKPGSFHAIKDNVSYNLEVVNANYEDKSFSIKVNGNTYSIELKDKYDELLKSLGLDNLSSKKVNDIKAPMPGLVLEIRVKEGDWVAKGDAILVLEAMKMENIIKSAGEGKVKKVAVNKGVAVEKNQLLVSFE
jgi:biotin carboxyl carrier protein